MAIVARPAHKPRINVLRTIEDAWQLPALGQAAGATAMTEFFKP
mgnify:CR=1 FL=1